MTSEQLYFEDVDVGTEFEDFQQPKSEHVIAFMDAGLQGRPADGQDRFRNFEKARLDGLEKPIVPGAMSTAILTQILSGWVGPLGRIAALDISFRRPVFHDDKLRCHAVVTDVDNDLAEAGGPAIVQLDVAFENERGERPVQGTAEIELPRRVE